MKTRAIKAGFAVSALALAVSPAIAATDLRIDGFANFAAGQMLSDTDEGSMYGYDEDVSFAPETQYGIQFRGDLKEDLSVTAQIVGRGSEDYDAKVTWAYVSYAVNDEWTIRAGRSRVPYFMYSDFLDVAYAYHWLRPPAAVYTLGFENQDGITAEYVTDIGPLNSRLTLMAGRSDSTVESGGDLLDVSIRNQMGGAWSLTYDWFTARIAYFESRLAIPNEGTAALADGIIGYDAALALFVPGYTAGTLDSVADDVQFDEDKASFAGFGVSADVNNIIAVAEYTMVRSDETPLEDRDAWYVSAGYRIQKFTVFGTFEKWNFNAQTDTVEEFERSAPITGIAPLDAGRAGILDGLQQAFVGTKDADTVGVGLRYDFHPSAAFKVEYNQMDNQTDDTKPKSLAVAVQLTF